MRLLVSVRDAEEARAALAGGAEIIDAKEPALGALGAVRVGVLREILAAVNGMRPVSAALGDSGDVDSLASASREAAEAGAMFVKVGFADVREIGAVRARLARVMDGALLPSSPCAVVAVAYADWDEVGGAAPSTVLAAAAAEGAMGVLVDTVRKDGAGLFGCLGRAALGSLVQEARERSLLVALAGRITVDDMAFAYEAGAEIVGVRGAACEHGREGRVRESKVRELVTARDLLRVHRGDSLASARDLSRETSFR
ncbi:MAG: (5-formylfuran-3-yl)methyl phosphate synthase [Gemmatimonadota bacterium]|nr:(5-formylfuran-3-yl)methyl phosphate synthase [Gemmatimonadota bacterium]